MPSRNGSAPKTARASSVRPAALQAGDADDLAGPHLEVDVVAAPRSPPSRPPARRRRCPPARRAVGEVVRRARGRPSARPASGRIVGAPVDGVDHVPAVLQHGHPVGELRTPRAAGGRCRSTARPRVAAAGGPGRTARSTSCVGQRRGRLVHDQDAGVERQRLGDLDHLLLGDRQRAGTGVRGANVPLPQLVEQRRGSRSSIGRRSMTPNRAGSRPRKMFSATVRSGSRLNSW